MKKMLVVMLMAITTFSLSACTSAPDEDATTVIKKAWEKLVEENEEFETGTIQFDGDAKLTIGENKGNLKINMDLDVDASSLENPKVAAKADLSGDGIFEGQAGEAKLSGEIRSIDKINYFFLENFSLDTGDAQVDLMANFAQNFFKSKWISVKDELLDDGSLNPEEIDPEKMLEILKENQMITLKRDMGDRTYEVEIDAGSVKNFIIAVAEETGEDLSASELEGFEEFFTTEKMAEVGVSYDLQVSINSDYEFTWAKIMMDFADPDSEDNIKVAAEVNLKGPVSNRKAEGELSLFLSGEENGSFEMNFNAVTTDTSVSIEVPENAEEFDPSSFLGLGGGLGGGLGAGDLGGLPPEAELGL
jgi:hypothetical protein